MTPLVLLPGVDVRVTPLVFPPGVDVRVTPLVLLPGVVVTMQGCHVLCSVHVMAYAVLIDMLHNIIMYDISQVNALKHHTYKQGSSNIKMISGAWCQLVENSVAFTLRARLMSRSRSISRSFHNLEEAAILD